MALSGGLCVMQQMGLHLDKNKYQDRLGVSIQVLLALLWGSLISGLNSGLLG